MFGAFSLGNERGLKGSGLMGVQSYSFLTIPCAMIMSVGASDDVRTLISAS
jgi:hypothetical protein